MPRGTIYYSILFIVLFSGQPGKVLGQPAAPLLNISLSGSTGDVSIGTLFISGNKKTKDEIIFREIPFRSGEIWSLEKLIESFETARRQLMNTALFSHVVVAAKNISGNVMDISIEVNERNYFFPIPYFKLADRNLNQWLVEHNARLDRVNYGVKLFYNNATGTNDKLRLGFTAGYTRQLFLTYDRIFFDRKMKWGFKFGLMTGKNHELNYNTRDNKQVFLKNENRFLRKFSSGTAQLTYRPAIKTRHSLGFNYLYEQVADSVLLLNPDYLKAGRNTLKLPGIAYTLGYYDLDYIPYPTRGFAAEFSIGKNGFGPVNNFWHMQLKGLASWPVSEKYFFSVNFLGGVKLPFRQPWFNRRFLGYADVYLQGFEYYVVDGVAGGYLKTSYNRKLLEKQVLITSPGKSKGLLRIPFKVIGKIYGNAGYAYLPEPGGNSLNNRMLWSGGIGIDIVTLYDLTIRLEWSFNSLGQNGLFLHRKNIF